MIKKITLASLIFFIVFFDINLALFLHFGFGFEIFGIIKPVTLMQYSLFFIFALSLYLIEPLIYRIDKEFMNLIIIVLWFCVMASFFEMMWAFHAWFAFFVKSSATTLPQLDLLHYQYVFGQENMNFGAKRNTLVFFISAYALYVVHRIKTERLTQKKRVKALH